MIGYRLFNIEPIGYMHFVSAEIHQLLLNFSNISPWGNTTISNTSMVGKIPIYQEQNIKKMYTTLFT